MSPRYTRADRVWTLAPDYRRNAWRAAYRTERTAFGADRAGARGMVLDLLDAYGDALADVVAGAVDPWGVAE